jgi:RimJ/RimL family protein N-acetyltransferase
VGVRPGLPGFLGDGDQYVTCGDAELIPGLGGGVIAGFRDIEVDDGQAGWAGGDPDIPGAGGPAAVESVDIAYRTVLPVFDRRDLAAGCDGEDRAGRGAAVLAAWCSDVVLMGLVSSVLRYSLAKRCRPVVLGGPRPASRTGFRRAVRRYIRHLLRLRLGLDDAAWYVDQARDAVIQRFTSESADLTVPQAEAGIRKAMGDPVRLSWAITRAGTGELLGNAGLDMDTGEICYWVATAMRGQGIATAAVQLMTEHAFAISDRSAVYLWIRPNNDASARVAVKAGFRRAPELDRLMTGSGDHVMAQYYELARNQ